MRMDECKNIFPVLGYWLSEEQKHTDTTTAQLATILGNKPGHSSMPGRELMQPPDWSEPEPESSTTMSFDFGSADKGAYSCIIPFF